MAWFDVLAVQGTLKSLLQHHSSKASFLWGWAFFIIQLSHPFMNTGKTIALTRRTVVGKVMPPLFNRLPTLVIPFPPRNKSLLISRLQSPSSVILPEKIKSVSVSIFPHLFAMKWLGVLKAWPLPFPRVRMSQAEAVSCLWPPLEVTQCHLGSIPFVLQISPVVLANLWGRQQANYRTSSFSNLHLLDQSPVAGHLHGFHSCYCMEQASGACCYTSVPSVFGFTLSGSQSHLKPYSKLGPLWTTPFKHWQDDGLLRGLPR